MDVFYAVLKYENVKQTAAYGVMNFLSEYSVLYENYKGMQVSVFLTSDVGIADDKKCISHASRFKIHILNAIMITL